MKRLFLGNDYRFGALAFLCGTVASGLMLRFSNSGAHDTSYYALSCFVMAVGVGCLYGGLHTNYMALSWQLFHYPTDHGLRKRLMSLIGMRRSAMLGLGFTLALANNLTMLAIYSRDIFSPGSLGAIGCLAAVLAYSWFLKRKRGR
ncbi:hypothetical protein [Aeromonas sp. Y311-2]|uniref:hypothetical protein n=1 Tax=Aeromonas sp. Y311-2 TaxID=2990507 RepID=UPI0022DEC8A9|nr:hypothetical protein [Aeromonas sp. Y311-2]